MDRTVITILVTLRRATSWGRIFHTGTLLLLSGLGIVLISNLFHTSNTISAIILSLSMIICLIGYIRFISNLFIKLWTSKIYRTVIISIWGLCTFAGDWAARNCMSETLGLSRSDAPYTHASLSIIGALVFSLITTALLLSIISTIHWFLRSLVYGFLENTGVITFIDDLLKNRTIKFILHLRKDFKLPKPMPNFSSIGFFLGNLIFITVTVTLVVAFSSIIWRSRQAISLALIYSLDAVTPRNGSLDDGVRILKLDNKKLKISLINGKLLIQENSND